MTNAAQSIKSNIIINEENSNGVVTKSFLSEFMSEFRRDLFEMLDIRFDRIENRLEKVEGRLDTVESRLGNVEGRMVKLEDRLTVVEQSVSALRDEVEEANDASQRLIAQNALNASKLDRRVYKLEHQKA